MNFCIVHPLPLSAGLHISSYFFRCSVGISDNTGIIIRVLKAPLAALDITILCLLATMLRSLRPLHHLRQPSACPSAPKGSPKRKKAVKEKIFNRLHASELFRYLWSYRLVSIFQHFPEFSEIKKR